MKDTGVTWTNERVEQLKKLWEEGLSASRIASLMGGITRNAVIGKVHRLGLSGRAKSKGSSTPRPRRKPGEIGITPTRKATQRVGQATASKFSTKETSRQSSSQKTTERVSFAEKYKTFTNASMPECKRVTIMELNDYVCRWPLGDPSTPEFRFCGGDSATGMPYCPYHCSIAYQPAQERKKDRKTA